MAHQGAGKAALAAVLVSGAARDPAAARSGIVPAAAAVRPDLGVPARRAADSAGFFAPRCQGLSAVRGLEAYFIPAMSSKAGTGLQVRWLAGVSRPAWLGAAGRVRIRSVAGAMTASPGPSAVSAPGRRQEARASDAREQEGGVPSCAPSGAERRRLTPEADAGRHASQ